MKISTAFQRGEAGVLVVASLYFYGHEHGNWWLFALLWLAADLSMFGYLAGPKVGAVSYNLAHNLGTPAVLVAVAAFTRTHWLLELGIVLLNHIAVDRTLGYGLKEAEGFEHTHLGLIGKARQERAHRHAP